MKAIFNIVKIDWLSIKKYIKLYLYLIFVACFFTVASKDMVLSSITVVMLISVRGVSLIYEIQEKNNCDKLYNYLPVSIKQIVLGRYFSINIINFIVLLLFIVLQIFLFYFMSVSFYFTDVINSLFLGSLLLSCSISIQIPLFYRLGSILAKPFSFLPIILYSLLVYFIKNNNIYYNLGLILIMIGILILIFYFISYKLSINEYRKKEF